MSVEFQLIILGLYSILLVYLGLQKKPGLCSWHMFASLKMVEFDLSLEENKKIKFNPWEFLPHTHLSMSIDELKFFLIFLKVSNVQVSGTVTVRDNMKTFLLKVKNNAMVD